MAGPGAFISGCSGPVLSGDEAAFFRAADPFGFILFDRNLKDSAQIRRLTEDLRLAVGREAPILIDQEGGRVQRLRPPVARYWLPPLDFALRAGTRAERAMFLRYRVIASELRALGIDVNCAPMLDIAGKGTHPFLRNRCYGTEAAPVARLGRAVSTGLLAGGVLPVVKHIPGHGRGRVDSHLELPRVAASPDALNTTDFAPFRELADLPMAMTAHVVYEILDPDHPATTSPRMVRLIRDEIGFGGLLMTDDLSMGALAGRMAERVAAALAAGCDMALHCNGELDEMEAVAGAARALSGPALERAEAALAMRRAADPIDIPAAEAELEALLAGGDDGRH